MFKAKKAVINDSGSWCTDECSAPLLGGRGTHKDNRDNGEDHDRIALLGGFLCLLAGPSSLADIGMFLLQIEQMV